MDRKKAIADIEAIFNTYRTIRAKDRKLLSALTKGKLYELFVLAHLLQELRARGFSLTFVGKSLKFKAAPGTIKLADPHFEVASPIPGAPRLRLFVDIEFTTLGASSALTSDLSCYHEVDIVIVADVTSGSPAHDDIVFAAECKSHAKLTKDIVKEVLGIRRELSLLHDPTPSRLSTLGTGKSVEVPARPTSEYRLVFLDPGGTQYAASPSRFGVEFVQLSP